MAEKTLKTRIKLRYDEYANWVSADPILDAGEVAVTAVPTGTGVEQTTPPAILFKVGNGDGENSRWSKLPWASGLAADVYAWAKAETKPTYDYSELTGTPTIPTVGNGQITIKQGSTTKGTFTVNQTNNQTIELTDNDTNTQYQLVLSGNTLKLQSRELTNGVWGKWGDVEAQSFILPDTTYTFATGSDDAEDGTFTVTPKDGSAQSVKIKGLKSAAYTESSAYATAAQGTTADNAMPKAGGDFTGNITVLAPTANMHPATKQYVDTAIGKINSFEYVVVQDALPTASKDTMYKIYLVADSTNKESQDNYDEYITVLTGTSTYTWEKIGNTTLDLSNYVNALSGTANSGVVTNISKSGNTISVTSTSLATSSPAASGDAKSFIDTIEQDANGKITATKKSISTMTGALESKAGSTGLVPAPAAGDQRKFLRGDGTWVYPGDSMVNVTKNETTKAYLLATIITPDATPSTVTSVADTGVYLGTDAGQLVAKEFKGKLVGNADTATKLDIGVKIDGVHFDGSEPITHYGECDTGSNEVVKTVICTWFQPVTGARIAVKFNNNNLASDPQLNVHGTGPKPIYYRGQPIPASYLAANRTYEFIYNGTQYDLVGDINTDTDTHYTARLFVGASNAAKSNAAATNGNVYINLVENNIVRDYHNIQGTGATTVTSDENGVITINSPTYTNTSHSHDVGVGLVGSGSASTSGGTYTYKAKLKDEAANANDSLARPSANANRLYPVEVDKSGYLAVTVPWTDTDTNTHYVSKNIIADSATNFRESSSSLDNGNVYLNHIEDGSVTSSHLIVGVGATKVQYDASNKQIKIVTDIDDSNYAKLDAGNIFKGSNNRFEKALTGQAGFIATNGIAFSDNTSYLHNCITRQDSTGTHTLTIPSKTGTIATVEDLSTYVSTDDVLILDGGNAAG